MCITWAQAQEVQGAAAGMNKLQVIERIDWKEQDESDNFGVTFLIPKDEIRYLIDAIEFALQLPKMKFNMARYQKLQTMKTTLKNYSNGK